MDEFPNEATETGAPGETRRDLLKKAAVGGAVVWAAPTVLAGRAAAQASGPIVACLILNTLWPVPAAGVDGYTTINGSINSSWTGSNVDLVGSAYGATPPWLAAASQNWVDLVAIGTTGSVSGTYTADCKGTYTLRVAYSRYLTEVNPLGRASSLVVSVFVNGSPGPVSGVLAPASTDENTYTVAVPGIQIGDVVTFTIVGTALEQNNVGPALGPVSFIV